MDPARAGPKALQTRFGSGPFRPALAMHARDPSQRRLLRWSRVRALSKASSTLIAWFALTRAACVALGLSWVCGCVIPIAPEFEAPEGNLSPYIFSAEPRAGKFVEEDQEISALVADPNLGDQLYVRWVFNYPDFTNDSRVTLGANIPPALSGSPVRSTPVRIRPACRRDLVSGLTEHRATLLVSDRPFIDEPDDAQNPYDQVAAGGFVARATWIIRKVCLQ